MLVSSSSDLGISKTLFDGAELKTMYDLCKLLLADSHSVQPGQFFNLLHLQCMAADLKCCRNFSILGLAPY